jgi:hypothetical protein
MQRRELSFKNYDEVISEIRELQSKGYTKIAKWNLGQICKHISYYMKGSLDGFEKNFPWILRVTYGNYLKKNLLSTTISKPNEPTDPKSIYPDSIDEKDAIETAIQFLNRLKENKEQLKPSSIMGELTNDEWNYLHKRHFAQHLSFLIPNK